MGITKPLLDILGYLKKKPTIAEWYRIAERLDNVNDRSISIVGGTGMPTTTGAGMVMMGSFEAAPGDSVRISTDNQDYTNSIIAFDCVIGINLKTTEAVNETSAYKTDAVTERDVVSGNETNVRKFYPNRGDGLEYHIHEWVSGGPHFERRGQQQIWDNISIRMHAAQSYQQQYGGLEVEKIDIGSGLNFVHLTPSSPLESASVRVFGCGYTSSGLDLNDGISDEKPFVLMRPFSGSGVSTLPADVNVRIFAQNPGGGLYANIEATPTAKLADLARSIKMVSVTGLFVVTPRIA